VSSFFKTLIVIFLLCSVNYSEAQNKEMFKQKRERKRVWRRWKSSNDAYNPYLKKKGKDKPSARVARGNKKEERIAKRENKKQLRRSKRAIKKHSTVR
jgi:hypothetical protein